MSSAFDTLADELAAMSPDERAGALRVLEVVREFLPSAEPPTPPLPSWVRGRTKSDAGVAAVLRRTTSLVGPSSATVRTA